MDCAFDQSNRGVKAISLKTFKIPTQDKKPKPLLKKQDTRVKLTKQTLTDDPLKLERPKMPSELYFMYDDGKAISGKEEAKIKCEFPRHPGTELVPDRTRPTEYQR